MKPRALAAALALSLLALVVPAPTQAAVPDVEVTFPSITRFNPTVTAYVVEVVDHTPEAGTLYVQNPAGYLSTIPEDGRVTIGSDFWNGDDAPVLVVRCTESFECSEVARSAPLAIWWFLDLHLPDTVLPAGPGAMDVPLLGGAPRGEPLVATWRILNASGGTVASGTDQLASIGDARLRIDVPADLSPHTRYRLVADVSGTSDDFAPLESHELDVVLSYDDDADADVYLPQLTTYFPVKDGYRDRLETTVRFGRGGQRGVHIDLVDARGRVVTTLGKGSSTRFVDAVDVSWDGRVAGRLVPAGRYTVAVHGEDQAGNVADVRTPLVISHQRLRWKTWKVRLSPSTSMIDSAVGRCSTLARLRGGGLGFHSQTKCSKAAQSVVTTVHGVYLPGSLTGYRNFRVSVRWGKAAGERAAYLVLGYLDARGRFTARRQLDDRPGLHQGARASSSSLIHDRRTAKPYTVWQLGLSEGSRYDVTGFEVQVDYRVLR